MYIEFLKKEFIVEISNFLNLLRTYNRIKEKIKDINIYFNRSIENNIIHIYLDLQFEAIDIHDGALYNYSLCFDSVKSRPNIWYLFKDSKIVYESVIIDDCIYWINHNLLDKSQL